MTNVLTIAACLDTVSLEIILCFELSVFLLILMSRLVKLHKHALNSLEHPKWHKPINLRVENCYQP